MKKKFLVRGAAISSLILGLFLTVNCAMAQTGGMLGRVEILSSPNPVGSGARALGMGGAFIAVADDATAASWNPGGLIQLEKPEMSVVLGYTRRAEKNSFGNNPEASRTETVDEASLNYLSAAYPFSLLGRNMIVSLNYQHQYDFNRDWDFIFNSSPLFPETSRYNYEQDGELYALGLAYCAQITRAFSVGLTVNYWGDFLFENQWEQKYTWKGDIDIVGLAGSMEIGSKDTYSFEGWNANLGFRWKISGKWTLGGVLKTPFTADIEHGMELWNSVHFPQSPIDNMEDAIEATYSEELDMPLSYGVGLAYRHSKAFTISADVYRTHWDDFESRGEDGAGTSPISGKPLKDSDIDPTIQLRLGAEYLIITPKVKIPLRAGLFYDPAPAEGAPDDYYGFSLGSGLVYERFVFDIAYQYRFGNDVGASALQNLDFSQDVREHTVYTSMIVHF